MEPSSSRGIEPPFLNSPGSVFLLDIIKVTIPTMIIPFIALVTLLIIFPKTLYFQHRRRKRSSDEGQEVVGIQDKILSSISAVFSSHFLDN